MNNLKNKRVLLGITGSIAAYKSADLVRRLREQGAEVRVVMTPNSCNFITPLTMQTLSGRTVYTDLFNDSTGTAMDHIELARWCDVVLVAPASVNFIARLAHGFSDDLLSTLCITTTVPIAIAPAMNQQMWLNVVTQGNIANLKERAIKVFGPAQGEQACQEIGPGRMVEPQHLLTAMRMLFSTGLLSNSRVMVTAGPTREAIDPVRYITNHSSGKMGHAIASAAVESGAQVTLISGSLVLPPPERVQHVSVDTAEQMRDAVMSDISKCDIFIAAAAVTDYRCQNIARQKIKKHSDHINLLLEKNPDILREVASLPDAPFTVGLAAETEQLLDNARLKFNSKKPDLLAANQVGENLGFNVDENKLEIFWQPQGQTLQHQTLGKAPKEKLARQLIQIIADLFYEKSSNKMH